MTLFFPSGASFYFGRAVSRNKVVTMEQKARGSLEQLLSLLWWNISRITGRVKEIIEVKVELFFLPTEIVT